MTLVAAAAPAWTAHDTRLIVCAAAAVALVVLPVMRAGLHAFPALMVGSLLMGLAAGEAPNAVATSFETGVGAVLGNVGVVLALGTMLGRLLADSGGADRIAEVLVSRSGRRLAPWTMALIAMIIGSATVATVTAAGIIAPVVAASPTLISVVGLVVLGLYTVA